MRKNLYMRKLFFIIGIMASVAGCSFGASAEVYSLDSCRQMALTSNKEMMVKAEKVRQAHYTRKEAFAAYLPAFDFTGGYFYNQKNLSIFDSDQHLPIGTFDPLTQSYK